MKSLALEDMVILILAVLLLSILLVLFLGFKSFTYSPIVIYDHILSVGRGDVVSTLISSILIFVGVFLAFIWTSSGCYGGPARLIACGALSAAVATSITIAIFWLASGIPFPFVGPIKIEGTPQSLNGTMTSYAIDCASMLNYGINDPTYGVTVNPTTCFVIHLKKSSEPYKFSELFSDINGVNSISPLSADSKTIIADPEDANVVSVHTFKVSQKKFVFSLIKRGDNLYEAYINLTTGSGQVSCDDFTFSPQSKYVLGDIGRCNNKLSEDNGYRYYLKPLGNDKFFVMIGDFKLGNESLPNGKIYVAYQENNMWHYTTISTSHMPDIEITSDGKKAIYVEFYDTYFGSHFYAPECGNHDMGEGVYVCIPK